MADCRVTCRRNSTYKTRSRKVRFVRTPGGTLTSHIIAKMPKVPHCAESGEQLHGIPRVNLSTISRTQRRVSRAYGGKLSASVTRERILRAFLMEEAKVAKQIKLLADKKQKKQNKKKHGKNQRKTHSK